MKAIIGLGNPGREYEFTRHNIGFLVIDAIAELWEADDFKPKFQGLLSEVRLGKEKIMLLKPQTYMNLSGQSVLSLVQFYKLLPEEILVIYDDLDLPPGKLRARQKGGAGGHNGLKSIIGLLGTEEFPRLKMGIGRPPDGRKAANYVLENFSKEEEVLLKSMIDQATIACRLWVSSGIYETMNRVNAAGLDKE